MAASMAKQQSKMCLSCFLRHGLHTRSLNTRVPRPTIFLQPLASSQLNVIGSTGWMGAQHRQMSVLYFILRNYEDYKKRHGKEPGPRFTMRYGREGAVARELISYGANVHFTNGKWYGRKTLKSWRVTNPGPEATNFTINAIDAKDSFVNQGAIEKMARTLYNVNYLNLDGCKYVDDHCLATLVHMRNSLTHLSINRCNQITDSGLANLHRLRNLERLNMNDLPLVTNAKLVAILLEDLIPNLRIGMVTEQIEDYKEKMKLLKDSEQKEEEIGDESSSRTKKTLPGKGSRDIGEDRRGEEHFAAGDKDNTQGKASSEWSELIRERPQRT